MHHTGCLTVGHIWYVDTGSITQTDQSESRANRSHFTPSLLVSVSQCSWSFLPLIHLPLLLPKVLPQRQRLRHRLRRRHLQAVRPTCRPGTQPLLPWQHHLRHHLRGFLTLRPLAAGRLRRLQLQHLGCHEGRQSRWVEREKKGQPEANVRFGFILRRHHKSFHMSGALICSCR